MKRIWIGLLLFAVAGLAVVAVLTIAPRIAQSPRQAAAGPPADAKAADWPMFRGGSEMLGEADAKLPDKLTLRWKFKTGAAVTSSPVVAFGKVYVGSGDANVYCLDAATGKKSWQFKTGDSVEAPPVVIGRTVYVGSSDTFLYALDAETGKQRWKFETDEKVLGSANTFRDAKTGEARIVFGSYDFNLYCLDPNTGKKLWTYESDNYINGGVAVAGGRSVFGGCDAVIHVVGPDGKAAAAIEAEAYIAATPAFDGRYVYVGNYDGGFVCADVVEKKLRWTHEADEPFFSSPAIAGDRILVGSRDGKMYCLDRKTGKKRWAFATRDEINSSPVICGDRAVFGSNDGRLYVISLAEGKKVWSYDLGKPVGSSPAVAGGLVIVGCDDGYVYAFGPAK